MSTPAVIVMPGASLLEFTAVADGFRVHCPGCHAEHEFRSETTSPYAFVHFDGCPVHRQIVDALRQYERTTVRHG